MSFINFFRFINNRKSTDLIKINQFLAQEVAVLMVMVKEGRKNPNNKERRLLGILANDIKKILRKGLVPTMFQPETILKWYRQFANAKFDGSKNREYPGKGRPKIKKSTVKLIIQMANANRTWGADRIVGQLSALGIQVSDQTVLNVLNENGIPIAPDRKKEKTWNEFIKNHFDQIWSCDFLLVPVLTLFSIKHFHVFVFIQYCTRQIKIVGIRERPDGEWMEQVARNITGFEELSDCKYLIHDRDPLYTLKFEQIFKDSGITPIKTPPRSPNLNPYAERVIRSIKEECLDNLIILGENNLRRILKNYTEHYHFERCHQGIENKIIESEKTKPLGRSLAGLPSPKGKYRDVRSNEVLKHSQDTDDPIEVKERLGGLLKYYYRQPA